jgi:hypothetical protein
MSPAAAKTAPYFAHLEAQNEVSPSGGTVNISVFNVRAIPKPAPSGNGTVSVRCCSETPYAFCLRQRYLGPSAVAIAVPKRVCE